MKTFLLMLMLSATALGQTETRTHKFFDWKNNALLTVSAATFAADGITTAAWENRTAIKWNQTHTVGVLFHKADINPLARPFVKTTAGNAAYFAGSLALETAAMHYLHNHGHHRLERILPAALIGTELFTVTRNYQGIRAYDNFGR